MPSSNAPYSHSKMSLYQQCQLAWWYRYKCSENTGTADTKMAAVGHALHEFMAQYVAHLVSVKQETDWIRAREILAELVKKFISADIRAELQEVGDKLIDWYNHTSNTVVIEGAIGMDKTAQKVMPFESAYYRGYIDRVDLFVEESDGYGPTVVQAFVIDYKSGYKETDDLKPENSKQLALYGALGYCYLVENWPAICDKYFGGARPKLSTNMQMQVWHLRSCSIKHAFTTIFAVRDVVSSQIAAICESIDTLVAEPAEGSLSDMCAHCDFRRVCKTLNSGQGMAKAILEWIRDKEEIKNQESLIKAMIREQGGTVMVNNHPFGFSDSYGSSWDGAHVRKWLIEAGMDPEVVARYIDAAIHFNQKEFVSICKKNRLDIEAAMTIATPVRREKFGFVEEK